MQTAASQSEMLEEIDGLAASDFEELRLAARKNLYFLCSGILGWPDVSVSAHGAFCRHIQSSPKTRRLGLMPRAHLKSTIATVGDSIRLALDEPDNARVLIAGETSTLAEKFLGQIKGHFESNVVLRKLFPELLPTRFSGPGVKWNNDMATLRRGVTLDSPTWQAIGVGGAITGSHFTRIKCDDLIGFESIKSPAAMATAKSWVDTIEPLLVNQNSDIIDFIGTRWSRNDLYAHVMKGYGEELGVFTRRAVENGVIIFPQLHNWAEYERIQRVNPALWAAQYENNPLSATATDFKIENVLHFRFTHDEQHVVTPRGKRWALEELDRILTADPNSGSLVAPDAAAISVQAVSPDDEVFVLESWSDRVSPSDYVDLIYRMARRWDVRLVGIEKAGQQNTDHYFGLKAEREHYHVRIVPLIPGNKQSKPDRIRGRLQPIINSRLLHILPSQTTLREQLSTFPDTVLWDELDALAYGTDLWQKPARQEEIEARSGAVNRLMAMRSPLTGY